MNKADLVLFKAVEKEEMLGEEQLERLAYVCSRGFRTVAANLVHQHPAYLVKLLSSPAARATVKLLAAAMQTPGPSLLNKCLRSTEIWPALREVLVTHVEESGVDEEEGHVLFPLLPSFSDRVAFVNVIIVTLRRITLDIKPCDRRALQRYARLMRGKGADEPDEE